MKNRLVITIQNDKIISALFIDREMIQVSVEHKNNKNILGNIYVGQVKNIIKNISAAFIEIKKGVIGYYSLFDNSQDDNFKKIKSGDNLLVQVIKEPIKSKGPVLTSNIEIAGKYVVLTYNKAYISVSSKIADTKDKNRLINLINPYINDEFGFIIRTNAKDALDSLIINEINNLISIYNNIKSFGIYKTKHSLIYEGANNYISNIRDGYSQIIDEIITDNNEIYNKIYDYLKDYQKEDLLKLKLYNDKQISLNNFYGIDTKLKQALKKSLWLKSGASIVIEHTEALTVIDVNSSKAVAGKKHKDSTFYSINLEAAKEIAKQLRLRNISGIIIVDFIDMKSSEYKKNLLDKFDLHLKSDPIRTTLVGMTTLGLVEITRKKVRKPLYEQFYLE